MAKNILICDDNQDVVIQEEFVVEEALVAIKKRGNIRTFTSAKACLTAWRFTYVLKLPRK